MKKNFYYLMNIFLISMSISMSASHKEMSASHKEIAREYLNTLYLNIHDLTTSNEHIPEQPSSDISEEQPTDIPKEPRANKPESSVVNKNYFTAPIQNSIEGKNADNFTAPIQNPIKDDPPNIPLPEHSMLRFMTRANPKDPDAAFGEPAVAAGDTSLELPISDSMPSELAVKEIAKQYLSKLYSKNLAEKDVHDLTTSNEHIPEQPSSDISEEQPTHIPEEPRANKPESSVVKNNFTAPIQNPIEGANIMDDPWLLGEIPFKPNNFPNIPLPEHSMLRANREDSTDSTDSDAAFGEPAVAAGDTSLELPISDSMPSELAVNLSALSLGALGISSSALAAIGAKILLSSALLPFAPYITVAIIISEIGTVTVAATSFFLSGYLLAAYWHYSNDLTANESFNDGGIIEI